MAFRATIAVVGALAYAGAGNALAQESDDVFTLDFDGPDVLSAAPGETVSGVYLGILRHSGPGEGALGWSASLTAENARITGIGAGISDRGPIPDLRTDASRYVSTEAWFEQSRLAAAHLSHGECEGLTGAISSVVICLCEDLSFSLPPRSSSSVLYLVLEREVEEGPQLAALRFVDGCASSQPVNNVVTQAVDGAWQPVQPIKGTKTIEFVPALPFLRGDANASGRVDISDAIRIFMTLFQGADPFPCADAADATDDGSTDITDGLRILLDFFVPDTAIPAPGPFSCGPDPTPDQLSCMAPSCA